MSLRNLADKALEGQLADQQVGRLLVPSNFAEGDRAGAVAMGLLDPAGGGRRLTRGLKSKPLDTDWWSSASRLARCLLGSGKRFNSYRMFRVHNE